MRFNKKETLERIFKRLEASEIYISRARMDCGSCSEEIVDMVEAHCRHFYIRANRCSSFYDSMFALTGWKTVEINGIEFEMCIRDRASALDHPCDELQDDDMAEQSSLLWLAR